jgi:PTS system mannose-specific IIA component
MYGILVVSHGKLSEEFINSAKMIVGDISGKIKAVSLVEGLSPEDFIDNVISAIMETMDKDGVLILTDLFGGSTTNFIASKIFEKLNKDLMKKIVIISGINLAMLLSAITNNEDNIDIQTIADRVINDAIDNIVNVSKMLNKDKYI